ncbi:hypothetical protein BsIDN1_29510 [Bacillus safensis]|uniref:Uncharacterized protein n=1 Tax=Bacillus safensis TaxID=561879 RepID=A0A5S9M878_BACIA|nr:hypothetical protein BsIDN1_29510 [Bacillus safensis]
MKNPFEMLFGGSDEDDRDRDHSNEEVELESTRKRIAHQLAMGELEDHYVTIEVEEQQPSMFDMLQGSGMEQMGMNMQDALGNLMPKKKKTQKADCQRSKKGVNG